MTDLTKITSPFGTLPRTTQMALFEARLYGEVIEYFCNYKWVEVPHPGFYNSETYRVRPAPITYDSINWNHVAPQFIAMVRDGCGDALLWEFIPTIDRLSWHCLGSRMTNATVFSSYTRGTCDWKDSFVLRPGVAK